MSSAMRTTTPSTVGSPAVTGGLWKYATLYSVAVASGPGAIGQYWPAVATADTMVGHGQPAGDRMCVKAPRFGRNGGTSYRNVAPPEVKPAMPPAVHVSPLVTSATTSTTKMFAGATGTTQGSPELRTASDSDTCAEAVMESI